MKRTLIVLLALAALAGAWWGLRERPAAAPEAPKVVVEASTDASTLAPPAPVEEPPAEAASEPTLEPALEAPPTEAARLWTLRGSVVRAGLAEADAQLGFHLGERTIATRTSPIGLFEVELPLGRMPPGGLARCSIVDVEGRPCFDGVVRLEQDVQLEVREPLELRGQVQCNVPRSDERLVVELFEPALRARHSPRRLASLSTDALGNFSCAVTLHEPHEFLHAEVSLVRGSNPTQVIALRGLGVALSELLSPAGATLALDVARVQVFVTDERGEPLQAWLTWPEPGARGFPPERNPERGTWTDEQGSVELTVAAGLVELAGRAAAHAARRELFHVGADTRSVELRLPDLLPEHELFGTILLPDGRPAEGASVSASLGFAHSTRRWWFAATDELGTGADGSFRLPALDGTPLELLVTHSQGTSGPWSVSTADSPLVLTLAPVRTLQVELAADALAPESRPGALDWVAHQRESGRVVHGVADSAPFELPGLAPGLWDIYVVAAGLGGAGTATADLGPWSTSARPQASVLVPLAPAHWVDAHLRWSDGQPLAETWLHARGAWPEEVAELLGSVRTDSTGHARAFCDSPRATLLFWPDSSSAEPQRAEVLCDTPAELIVRP